MSLVSSRIHLNPFIAHHHTFDWLLTRRAAESVLLLVLQLKQVTSIKRYLEQLQAASMLQWSPEPFAVAYASTWLNTHSLSILEREPLTFAVSTEQFPGRPNAHRICWWLCRCSNYPRSSIQVQRSPNHERYGTPMEGTILLVSTSTPDDPVMVDFSIEGKQWILTSLIAFKERESIVDPIVENVKQLIADSNPEYHDQFRRNMVLAGGGSGIRGLGALIERRLSDMGDVNVHVVDGQFDSAQWEVFDCYGSSEDMWKNSHSHRLSWVVTMNKGLTIRRRLFVCFISGHSSFSAQHSWLSSNKRKHSSWYIQRWDVLRIWWGKHSDGSLCKRKLCGLWEF